MIMNNNRPIRSYVKRQGRLTKAQKNAIELHGRNYLFDFQDELISVDSLFEKNLPIVFEIGFGMGGATFQITKDNPEKNFIVTDVHQPGIGNLIKLCAADSLENIKIIQHDGLEVLRTMFTDYGLLGINIFFPDPWHKKRHNKRRLINKDSLELFSKKIMIGGLLHIATDWEPYAMEIIDLIRQDSNYEIINNDFNQRPKFRPETKYESRGMRLGHKVWDILAKRR